MELCTWGETLFPLRNCNNIILIESTIDKINSKANKTADQANTLHNLILQSAVMLLWHYFVVMCVG